MYVVMGNDGSEVKLTSVCDPLSIVHTIRSHDGCCRKCRVKLKP